MADIHSTIMHYGLNSFKKVNQCLLKNAQKTFSYFLTCVKILIC